MFDRPPYDAVTIAMITDADDGTSTIGWNLFHDPRITDSRFTKFSNEVASAGHTIDDAATMQDGLSSYYRRCVHFTKTPDFLVRGLNLFNYHGRPGPLPLLHGSKLLTSVFNLALPDDIYREAKSDGLREFQSFGRKKYPTAAPPTAAQWLDDKLASLRRPAEAFTDRVALSKHPFVVALLWFLNQRRVRYPFQPTWATLWDRFDAREWDDPLRWQSLLGVRRSDTDTWLLLLRYPVREAGTLLRPTQLDAGWYPEHFPASLSATTGHAMDLDAARRICPPMPEFIHQQIDHLPEHVIAIARVPGTTHIPAAPAQRRHYRVLKKTYADTATWTRHPHPSFSRP